MPQCKFHCQFFVVATTYTISFFVCFRDTNALAVSVAPLQGDGATMMAMREFSSPLTPLSLLSDDVILLGGSESLEDIGSAPSDGFSGCLDRVVVNNAQLSLLLPNLMNRDLATCTPR